MTVAPYFLQQKIDSERCKTVTLMFLMNLFFGSVTKKNSLLRAPAEFGALPVVVVNRHATRNTLTAVLFICYCRIWVMKEHLDERTFSDKQMKEHLATTVKI